MEELQDVGNGVHCLIDKTEFSAISEDNVIVLVAVDINSKHFIFSSLSVACKTEHFRRAFIPER